MWGLNQGAVLWISWLLALCSVVIGTRILDEFDVAPSIDFLADDESVIDIHHKSDNLQFEAPRSQDAALSLQEGSAVNSSGTENRIGFGFLFGGGNSYRPKQKSMPKNQWQNSVLPPEYTANVFLTNTRPKTGSPPEYSVPFLSNVNYNFDRQTTTRRPNHKQSQWQWETSPSPNWEQPSSWNGNSNNNNWQTPSNSWNNQPVNNYNNQPVNNYDNQPFNNNNKQPVYNYENQPVNNYNNQPVNNNNKQPANNYWTTKRPQQTTKKTTSWYGGGDQELPVWEEKTTTPGRYRPSPTRKPQRKSVSELKCEEYSKQFRRTVQALPLALGAEVLSINLDKCDRNAQALVVGGKKADLGEFPHMAAIGYKANRGLDWQCGGSLISKNYVMTAAHCTGTGQLRPVAVRLGDLNLVRGDDGASPQTYNVAQVIVHPEYKTSKNYNDIALLRLDRDVEITEQIRPACLYNSPHVEESRALATGWGRIGYTEQKSNDLLKVGLNFIDNNKCHNLYRNDQSTSIALSKGIIESHVCAGDLDGGHDTCSGDSGGPLQVTSKDNNCIYKIVGVTSFGKKCAQANSAGVYTRVSYFVPWIESIVWP